MSIQEKIFSFASDGGGPSLDRLLAMFDKELENLPTLVQPAPESKPRTPFDSPDVSSNKFSGMRPTQLPELVSTMLPMILKMRQGAKLYDREYQPTADTATPEFIEQIEKLARQDGARDIRYIKVPRNAIFKGKGLPYQNAIIFTVEMDKDNMSTAPSFDSFLEVAKGYKRMTFISHKVAVLMRKHGFAAYPGTALGGITDYTYLGELAGLGAMGHMMGFTIEGTPAGRGRLNLPHSSSRMGAISTPSWNYGHRRKKRSA